MKLAHHQNIHSKEVFNFGLEISKVSQDPDKIVFNYSSHNLSKSEKNLLCKDLKFAIPPDKREYSDYLLRFNLLYCEIKYLDLLNEKINFLELKSKTVLFNPLNYIMKKALFLVHIITKFSL